MFFIKYKNYSNYGIPTIVKLTVTINVKYTYVINTVDTNKLQKKIENLLKN